MKILYKNLGFGGGAPKSLLQYVIIAKNNNLDVVVVGEFTHDPKEYRDNNIRLINLQYFHIRYPIKSFLLLMRYLKIIELEKPDLIHTTTMMNCYFHKIITRVTNIPIIYNVPGGKVDRFSAKLMGEEELLTYSDENKIELIKYGYDKNKIKVISNRINCVNLNDEYEQHYGKLINSNDPFKLLLISRMTDNHVNSIKFVIDLAMKLNENQFTVKLDILGDGKHYYSIKNLAHELNNTVNRELISVHGYKENVSAYIKDSHVIFGKGRSVIDGILNCRLSYVVSENNTFSLCNLKTFENLRTYNFSGRNLEYVTTYKELEDFILKLYQGNREKLKYIKSLKKLTREFYDIEYAETKIMDIYKSARPHKIINYKPSLFYVCFEYLRFYFKAIKIKLKEKIS